MPRSYYDLIGIEVGQIPHSGHGNNTGGCFYRHGHDIRHRQYNAFSTHFDGGTILFDYKWNIYSMLTTQDLS
jgi:hypothetical protein